MKVVIPCACMCMIVLGAGCLKNAPSGPGLDVNLLQNSSFESSGAFSLQGWHQSADSLIDSSTDAPQGGSVYSVAITPGIYPVEGAVYQAIPAIAGVHVFQFSVWGKQQNAEGEVYIDVLYYSHAAPPLHIVGPTVFSTVWDQYKLLDTISANAGDSIRIGLESDSGSEGRNGLVFYNHCTFEEIQ